MNGYMLITHSQFPFLTLAISICVALVFRYAVMFAKFRDASYSIGDSHKPALVPYAIPIIGNIPFRFFLNPVGFSHDYFALWQRRPVQFRALSQQLYIIQGRKFLAALFKIPASTMLVQRVVGEVFLLPQTAVKTYLKDDSGYLTQPHPGTHVEHRNRLEFHKRFLAHRLLLGSGQISLFRRFYFNASRRLSSLPIGQEWTDVPNFLDFFKKDLTAATMESLTGLALLQRHPSFIEDLWTIDENMMGLLLKKPRFLNAEAHKARDRALDAIIDWHKWASDNFNPESVNADGDDPFWGSAFFRERQTTFSSMDGFDCRAIASEDLSFIWSANTNAIVASFWIALEAFRDPALLQAIREEIQPCLQIGPENQLHFDVDLLLKQPILQACFAENLRLRVHGFLLRYTGSEDRQLEDCIIPRNQWCVASVTPASMDPEVWCQGENSMHPVKEFWPGRFLKTDQATKISRMSLDGLDGSWVPFGGGHRECPGRIFTKRQNILALAMMVTYYDCEVLASDKDMALKSGAFPLGVVPPHGMIPVRMRRRALSSAPCGGVPCDEDQNEKE